MSPLNENTNPITDEELLDELWELAFDGLDKAYETHHDFDGTGVEDEEKWCAQGEKDSYRRILVLMRQHSRYWSRENKGNERSGSLSADYFKTLRELRGGY